ncbi:succinate dehydrogenase iron-sulfur subunit, partial [Ralstonia pickettii]
MSTALVDPDAVANLEEADDTGIQAFLVTFIVRRFNP